VVDGGYHTLISTVIRGFIDTSDRAMQTLFTNSVAIDQWLTVALTLLIQKLYFESALNGKKGYVEV
jgi:hypothetical protein